MGKQIEKSGKTVDEAIWNGVQEMGLSVDEVDIEIIQKGSLGLLGIGAKPAIVRLTEKEHEELDVKSMFEQEEKPQAKPSKHEHTQSYEKRQKHFTSSEKKHDEHPEAVHTQPKENKTEQHINTDSENMTFYNAEAEMQDNSDEQAESSSSAINYTEECAQSNEAAQFLSELLKYMNVDATLQAAETDDSLKIKIDTESAGVLIGHRGETLDALQYLTLLVANRNRNQKEYTRVTIDTQGYREKREEVLMRLAKSKASTVRASGKPYRFEPMSPYERRIIHSTLQSNAHVSTHSEGVEPYRYVVITSTQPNRRPRRQPRNMQHNNANREY